VFVRSFSDVAEDFTSTGRQADLQVSSIHSRAQSLVLGVLFPLLLGFSNAYFAGCPVDRKSTSGTCQFLGSSLVSWSSRKQSSVAQSTTDAEYVVVASCCSQLLWITYTLSDFGEECSDVPLMCDSTSAISFAKNPMLHSRTKHIENKATKHICTLMRAIN
jgi:hypothetical protein